jgi:hypothetical protein
MSKEITPLTLRGVIKLPPLKIRGARPARQGLAGGGVMMREITPLNPPLL